MTSTEFAFANRLSKLLRRILSCCTSFSLEFLSNLTFCNCSSSAAAFNRNFWASFSASVNDSCNFSFSFSAFSEFSFILSWRDSFTSCNAWTVSWSSVAVDSVSAAEDVSSTMIDLDFRSSCSRRSVISSLAFSICSRSNIVFLSLDNSSFLFPRCSVSKASVSFKFFNSTHLCRCSLSLLAFCLSMRLNSDSFCKSLASRSLAADEISSCSARMVSTVRLVSSNAFLKFFNCDASEEARTSEASASALALAAFSPAILSASERVCMRAVVTIDASRRAEFACVIALACSFSSFSSLFKAITSANFSRAN
mmetsp:Transcript_10518/g.15757  ORF Transcript_10518/g.15757 Transcript_10518/m.15757 type:complete len:310 (+) Transcript_10518:1421-2350(+)